LLVPIHWTERTRIPHLEEILEKHRSNGGAIVEYRRVLSAVIISSASPQIEWVPPGKNRTLQGLKHTLISSLLGWWSISGFFWTIAAIIQNTMGGIDVTPVFTAPPPAPGQPFDSSAVEAVRRMRKIHSVVFACVLFVLLGLILVFVALPPMRKAHWF
jgi:hypothetical protein